MLTSIALALATILRNRMRASLTVLGILIGVASLVVVTTLAKGVSAKVSGSLEGFGANILTVVPFVPPSGAKQSIPRALTEGDGRTVLREARSVAMLAPYRSMAIRVIHADRNEATTAAGTTLDYFTIQHLELARGMKWTEVEEAHKDKVCVLGSELAQRLFGKGEALGKIIRIGRSPCNVIGVLAPQNGSDVGENPDNVVLMPIGGFRARLGQSTPPGKVTKLVVVASGSPQRAQADIRSVLTQRHRIREGAPPDFIVQGGGEMQQAQLAIAAALSILLFLVGSVSLVVGGIGVMNIMLVSVAERTREIGIRISIGARSGDILSQFLVEAIVLSVLGGVLGLAVGALAVGGFGRLLQIPLSPSPMMALLAAGTSAAIGILFGYLPARRAAALDPIEALRSD